MVLRHFGKFIPSIPGSTSCIVGRSVGWVFQRQPNGFSYACYKCEEIFEPGRYPGRFATAAHNSQLPSIKLQFTFCSEML